MIGVTEPHKITLKWPTQLQALTSDSSSAEDSVAESGEFSFLSFYCDSKKNMTLEAIVEPTVEPLAAEAGSKVNVRATFQSLYFWLSQLIIFYVVWCNHHRS